MTAICQGLLGSTTQGVAGCLCGLLLTPLAWAASPPEPADRSESVAPFFSPARATWDEKDIRDSLRVLATDSPMPAPQCGDGVLDNRWRVVIGADAASVRIASAGSPARSLTLREGLLPDVHYLPDGRHALMATGSGWVLRLDLAQARLLLEIRVGQALRGTALSAPRKGLPGLLAGANGEPHTLVVLDEQLQLVKLLHVIDKSGRSSSGVLAIWTASARDSFVAVLKDAPELWEVSYNPRAPEIALGLVHDFQYREGNFAPGYLNPQRSVLESRAHDAVLSPSGHEVLTTHSDPDGLHLGSARLQVTHLDVRRKIAEFTFSGSWIDAKTAAREAWATLGIDKSALELSPHIVDSAESPGVQSIECLP